MSLVVILKGRSVGLTYKEMQEEFRWKEGIDVSVRNLQRMLATIRDDLGLEDELVEMESDYHHREKKFLIRELPKYMVKLDGREQVAIETHIKELEGGTLREALTKVVAGQEPLSVLYTNDLERLVEQTSHAGKAQPRTQYDRNQMRDIETAIIGNIELSFKYRSQGAKKALPRQVRPIGVVYNRFAYLIAATGNREAVSYRMDMLEDVKITDVSFTPKEGFNVMATANTKGKGSEDGRFIGTNILNEAFLERFAITIEQPYATTATEKRIVLGSMKKYGSVDEEFATNLVTWAEVIRKTFFEGGVDEVISTRRLDHIAKAFAIFDDKMKSIELCVNRFDDDTKESFMDLYTKIDAGVDPLAETESVNETDEDEDESESSF